MGNTQQHYLPANPIIPGKQQVKSEPNANHYIFLWVALGFAGFFMVGLVVGCFCNRKTPEEKDEEARVRKGSSGRQRVINPNRMSVKTSPVQPQPKSPTKAQEEGMTFASAPVNDATLLYAGSGKSTGRPLSFGPYRSVSQQIADFEETLMIDSGYEAESFAKKEAIARKESLLRKESLEQGLLSSSSLQQRRSSGGMESLRSFNDYLFLTSDLSFHRDSIDEECENVDEYLKTLKETASTIPINSNLTSNTIDSSLPQAISSVNPSGDASSNDTARPQAIPGTIDSDVTPLISDNVATVQSLQRD